MDRESLISEFLERLESAVDAVVEPCGCEGVLDDICDDVELTGSQRKEILEHDIACDATATGTLDKQAARAALDRLFKDLNDFVKEPAKLGAFTHGGKQIGVMAKCNETILRKRKSK